MLDWREDVSDIRRDLSIANYQYTDTKKSLWVAGASDTDESAARKMLILLKLRKISKTILLQNGIFRSM